MAEKINETTSDQVTSNKHFFRVPSPRQIWTEIPGSGRPDGPADDGSSGGPTVGGDWGGMQADGIADTSADEMAIVEEAGRRVAGEILHSASP